MRISVASVVAVLACALVALVWTTRHGLRSPASPQPEPTEPTTSDNGSQSPGEGEHIMSPPQKPAVSRSPAAPPEPAGEVSAATIEAQNEAYVENRVAELLDLGMENDSVSLKAIVAELHNPDRSIREAAVEALVQFGSREAIPELTQAAERTTDPEEKSAILEAVDFLNMPTLAEALAQTNPPASNPPPGTGSPR